MRFTKKPSRRELLHAVGHLQNLIGEARSKYENDRNPDGLEQGMALMIEAFDLCVSARSFDPPMI